MGRCFFAFWFFEFVTLYHTSSYLVSLSFIHAPVTIILVRWFVTPRLPCCLLGKDQNLVALPHWRKKYILNCVEVVFGPGFEVVFCPWKVSFCSARGEWGWDGKWENKNPPCMGKTPPQILDQRPHLHNLRYIFFLIKPTLCKLLFTFWIFSYQFIIERRTLGCTLYIDWK